MIDKGVGIDNQIRARIWTAFEELEKVGVSIPAIAPRSRALD